MRRASFAVCLLIAMGAAGCTATPGCANDGCVRILFLGNSYTSTNDLPGTFARLAAAASHRVDVAMVAHGGETLSDHAGSADDADRLSTERWDYVVLQEQSEIPAVPGSRPAMAAAVDGLAQRIRTAGATPLLFETWGHRSGLPAYGLDDYDAMQVALDEGYGRIGSEASARVVAVGDAWSAAFHADPALELWQPDGSHPTPTGTYLAALVFYAAVFGPDLSRLVSAPGAPSAIVAAELVSAAQSIVK